MKKQSIEKKVAVISLAILLLTIIIYQSQAALQAQFNKQSELIIDNKIFDSGFQRISLAQAQELTEEQWNRTSNSSYSNLYKEKSIWERITIHNPTNQSKTIVISEKGNYTTSHTIYSDLDHKPVDLLLSTEYFKNKIVLPANTQTTLLIEKTGYQLNNSSTKILEYELYRIKQFIKLISSMWVYGAMLGLAAFYLASVQSKQTHLSERICILAYAIITLVVTITENNFHSMLVMASPTIETIGQKIALPLLLVPLSSYILLRTYSINSRSHHLQKLCIIFFISSVLMAYCLINNYIIPLIYLSFTMLAFIHQACWIYHAIKSNYLGSIGQLASLIFLLSNTANHILVIALIAYPELTQARLTIINAYYLLGIASAIVMLNDKNILEIVKTKLNLESIIRATKIKESKKKALSCSKHLDALLEQVQKITQDSKTPIAKKVNSLRILNQEFKWKRAFINIDNYINNHQQTWPSILSNNNKANGLQKFVSFGKLPNAFSRNPINNQATIESSEFNIPATLLQSSSGKSVIIIDDSMLSAVSTARAIQHLGHQIEIFTNPLQAIDFLKIKLQLPENHTHFLAIISDQEMPEMSGINLLSEIIMLHQNQDIEPPKLVLFTSLRKKLTDNKNIHTINKSKANELIEAIKNA